MILSVRLTSIIGYQRDQKLVTGAVSIDTSLLEWNIWSKGLGNDAHKVCC